MTRTITRNDKKVKLYPVANFENNQHKIYNAYDRALLRVYEARETGEELDEAEENLSTIEKAMDWSHCVFADGLLYAPYDICQIMKNIIGMYDLRHSMIT